MRDFREMSLHGRCLQRFPACQRSQSPAPSFLSGKLYILRNYYTELHPQTFPIDRSTPGFTLRCENLFLGNRRAARSSRIAGRWPTKAFGGSKSMRRWIAWIASLLAGAFCFYPGVRIPWFGHGNEPRDEWALYVCRSVLALVRQQHIGREFCRNRRKAPLYDLQIQASCKPYLQFFAAETTKTAFARVARDCERRVASSQLPLVVTLA